MRKNIVPCVVFTAVLVGTAAVSGAATGLPVFGGISVEAAEPTYSPNWYTETDGRWRLRDAVGNVVTNAWVCDDAIPANGKNVWYLLDAQGYMIADPLVQDGTGNFYSLETEHNGYFGMLRYKPGIYDGVVLDLEQGHDGSFARIKNPEGLAAMAAKYPVKQVAINNDNIVYTSSFGMSASGTRTASESDDKSDYADDYESGYVSGRENDDELREKYGFLYDSYLFGFGSGSYDVEVRPAFIANDFETGNYDAMSKEEQAEVEARIEEFKAEYIEPGMSDLDKEYTIVGWLVENCSYESTGTWDNGTAYSCIVGGEASCAGYADAFLQTAKACGLDARYISNIDHAWNLVKINGKWRHVDVTWEDSAEDNEYGIGNLRGYYINLTDSEVKELDYHKTWTPDVHLAKD